MLSYLCVLVTCWIVFEQDQTRTTAEEAVNNYKWNEMDNTNYLEEICHLSTMKDDERNGARVATTVYRTAPGNIIY